MVLLMSEIRGYSTPWIPPLDLGVLSQAKVAKRAVDGAADDLSVALCELAKLLLKSVELSRGRQR